MNPQSVTPQTRLRDLTVEEFVALLDETQRPQRHVIGQDNVAKYLGVSRGTVRNLVARGGLNGALTLCDGYYILDTYKLK